MNNIYFSKINKYIILSFIFSILTVISLFINNYLITIVLLVISLLLYKGQVTSEVFYKDKDNIYIISKNSSILYSFILFISIIIGSILCVISYYKIGLFIFGFSYCMLCLFNIINSIVNSKTYNIELIKDIVKNKNYDYFVYKISDIEEYSKYRYEVKLVDNFNENSSFKTIITVNKNIKEKDIIKKELDSLVK